MKKTHITIIVKGTVSETVEAAELDCQAVKNKFLALPQEEGENFTLEYTVVEVEEV